MGGGFSVFLIGYEPKTTLRPRGRRPRRGHLPYDPRKTAAITQPAARRDRRRYPRPRPENLPSPLLLLLLPGQPLSPFTRRGLGTAARQVHGLRQLQPGARARPARRLARKVLVPAFSGKLCVGGGGRTARGL